MHGPSLIVAEHEETDKKVFGAVGVFPLSVALLRGRPRTGLGSFPTERGKDSKDGVAHAHTAWFADAGRIER